MNNKQKNRQRFLKILVAIRMPLAIICTMFIVIGLPWLNQAPAKQLTKTQQDATKMLWKNSAKVVMLGDSRTYLTIDPDTLADELGLDSNIFHNAGMSGQGLVEDYLDHAERVLDSGGDKTSLKPAFLVGITAISVVDPTLDTFNAYTALKDSSWLQLYLQKKFRWFSGMHPIWPGELPGILGFSSPPPRISETISGRTFYPNGFCSAEPLVYDEFICMEEYEAYGLRGLRLHRPTFLKLCKRIKKWTEHGINVFVFRPPSCTTMDQLEEDLLEFDPLFIAESIQLAGGFWLEVDRVNGIKSYDGSHVDIASAKLFTKRIGKAIDSYLLDMNSIAD